MIKNVAKINGWKRVPTVTLVWYLLFALWSTPKGVTQNAIVFNGCCLLIECKFSKKKYGQSNLKIYVTILKIYRFAEWINLWAHSCFLSKNVQIFLSISIFSVNTLLHQRVNNFRIHLFLKGHLNQNHVGVFYLRCVKDLISSKIDRTNQSYPLN